jgi:hypothetical protein
MGGLLKGITVSILLIMIGSIISQFQGSIPYGIGGVILAIMVISSLLDATKGSTFGAMVVALFTLLFAAAIGDSTDVGFSIIALLVGFSSIIGRRGSFL